MGHRFRRRSGPAADGGAFGGLRATVARSGFGRSVLLLALVCTVAGLAMGAALLLAQAERERHAMEERALAAALAIAHDAELEIVGAVARLEGLSASPALRAGDLRAFREQAAATPTPEGTWFVLLDQAGRQLANSFLPADGPLPEPDISTAWMRRVREVMGRDRPTVSSVVWSPLAGKHAAGVTIPVALGPDRRPGLLGVFLPARRLLDLVRDQRMPAGWRAGLLDKSRNLIARGEPMWSLGDAVPAAEWSTPLPDGAREGLVLAPGSSAGPALVAFARSDLSEWIAVVEVPLAVLQEPRRAALRRILLPAGALLALGLAAAWRLRGRIDRSFGALKLAADAADERQRAAEARFRHHWEHSPEGLFAVRVTPGGGFVFEGLNPAHERATGLANAAVAGKRPEQCLPPAAAAAVLRRYRNCVERGHPVRYGETLDLPGGRREWETSLAPMRDPETGRVAALFGTARDVTAQRRAERAVRANEQRLRLAQHAAGSGVWDWDLLTGELHASPEFYALLGLDPGAAAPDGLREAWLGLVHPDDRRRFEEALEGAVGGWAALAGEFRFSRGKPGGEPRWMACRGRLVPYGARPDEIETGSRPRLMGVAVDVTERRRAEADAEDTLALLQSSLDALAARVAILDGAGKVVAANAAWRKAEDRGDAGAAAGSAAEHLAACGAAQGASQHAFWVEEGVRAVARGDAAEFRHEYACPDHAEGRDRWFQLRVTRFGEGAGLRLVAAQEDVTDVRRSAEALEAAAGRLLTLQDEERRRIARELHDTTVQDLAMAAIGIDTAAKAPPGEARAAPLAEAREAVERAVRDARSLSYLLHPPLLDECGLPVALAAYARGFARRSALECELELDAVGTGMLRPGAKVALFRVAQEAFANVRRHSGARKVRVRLRVTPGREAELRVEDDGRGFRDPGAASGRSAAEELRSLGVGIPGMRARLRQLGGRLTIETGPSGTCVVATVPLSAGGGIPEADLAEGDQAPKEPALAEAGLPAR